MRFGKWVTIGLGGCLVVAVGVDLPLAYRSSQALGQQQRTVASAVAKDAALGLPAAEASGLRRRLAEVDTSHWWSPGFLFANQQQELTAVQQLNAREWSAALNSARQQTESILLSYRQYLAANTAWLADPSAAQEQSWAAQLRAAATPGALSVLLAEIRGQMTAVQSQVKAAQAKAAASVDLAQAPGGLLEEAAQLESIAKADGLSTLEAPQDAAALQAALAGGEPGTAQSAALAAQLGVLRAEIGLNDQLVQQSQTVLDLVDQAGAEQTPGYSSYLLQFQSSQQQLTAAQTPAQLAQVQGSLNTLQQDSQQSLAADQCGHTTIAGKSIFISLSLQEMVFYDNGCAVNATPVTTGRPLLRTPTGTFQIFDKQSPYVFISPWPPGSPFWYPTSPVNWVMEFDQGGYYIHDAPWEPTSEYGPGSENLVPQASHGCVQIPGAVMAWAYSWTPMGTPVVITN